MIKANNLARCPSCIILFVIGADLRPLPNYQCDEAAFNAAMNANPEVREWALKTLETARIRGVAEVQAECAVVCEWLQACGGSDLMDDLVALDAYAASFDERGYTRATDAVRRRATNILQWMSWGTRH